jgi:O-antigen/teichoic acid export membrane protein
MSTVAVVGALAFGAAVGYITYRTLIRAKETAVSDLTSVIAAIGGGAVTKLYDPHGDLFGLYAIGLAVGLVVYGLLYFKLNGKEKAAETLGGREKPRERDSVDSGAPQD